MFACMWGLGSVENESPRGIHLTGAETKQNPYRMISNDIEYFTKQNTYRMISNTSQIKTLIE